MSKKGFPWGRILEGAIGIYLILPGLEDVATAGATLAPSVALGYGMLVHAILGTKL